jgi:hypothetical protein
MGTGDDDLLGIVQRSRVALVVLCLLSGEERLTYF